MKEVLSQTIFWLLYSNGKGVINPFTHALVILYAYSINEYYFIW